MIVYYDQTHQILKSVEGSSAGAWDAPVTIDRSIGAPFSSIAKDSNQSTCTPTYYDKVNAP